MSKKREALLTSAEQLFYKNGFHSIGIKRVHEDAGVSLMTLYNHFQSKEELILEVLRKREERYFELLKTNSPTILSIATAHLDWLQSHQNGCLFLRAKEEFPGKNHMICQYVINHKNHLISFIEGCGYSAKDSFRLALLLEGATAMSEIHDTNQVREETLRMIGSIFQQ
ncbi:TetR/AcrR family transcriptional regulator [Alkalihalobacillus sp. NPDC078783]